jgi:lipopolysaccharide transport system permease protein
MSISELMPDGLSTEATTAKGDASSAPMATPALKPHLTIRASSGSVPLDVAELWRFRELFWILAARDIKVRYKQTILGSAWALIQPLAFTVLGTIVFGRLTGAGADGVKPAFLFYLISQLPWMLFNTGLQTSAMSLVGAQNMIKKIYFPRLVLPASAVMVSLVDFLVQLGLVAGVLLVLPLIPKVPAFFPPAQALLLPVASAWAFLAALAVGLPLAALNVEYRDVRYVIPFVTQFMIFAAPVFWSVERIPPAWRALYALLPIASPIDFFRWCLLGTPAHPMMWCIGALATIGTLIAGLAYFRRLEDTFADVV